MKKKAGFTLVELLIASLIFSVIAVTLYSVFSGGIRIWGRQKASSEYGQGMRLALDGISKELRNAVNYAQPKQEDAAVEELFFAGEAAKLSFVTQVKGELAKVSYEFEFPVSGQKGVLKRNVAFQKDGFLRDEKKDEAVLRDMDGFFFEYAYGDAAKEEPILWKDSWQDKSNLPRGVRVTLEFEKSGTNEKEIFRKTVFMPAGILGREE